MEVQLLCKWYDGSCSREEVRYGISFIQPNSNVTYPGGKTAYTFEARTIYL